MIQTKATIVLKRLVITKGKKPAYDENYHTGVNIIRSNANSTGKTTIMDTIFFVLGGDVVDWTDEMRSCDSVVAEIAFGKKVVTFRREIGSSRFPPIYIFEGAYTEAIQDSIKWLKFSHNRSNDRESFSQAIFRLLGYPENKLSTFANITIHEILRLVYSDQMTAVNKMFKHQDFDPDEMRQTVGEFLLGVDDLDLHGLRLQLRNKEKELSNLAGRLKATQEFFTSAGLMPDSSVIMAELAKITKERDALRERISYLESPVKKEKTAKESKDIIEIRKELRQVKQILMEYRERHEALTYDIEDSVSFISSLKEREIALDQSEVTRESLGELEFEFCPVCLSGIEIHSSSNQPVCHLCKKEKTDNNEVTGFLRMQFELNYQIKESVQLLDLRKTQLVGLDKLICEADIKRELLQERYNSFVETADPLTAELKNALTTIGQYEILLESLREKLSLVGIIDDISKEKAGVATDISLLADQIENKEKAREERWKALQKRISEITIEILRNDIPCEETFANATEFEFDFSKNRMLVDGKTKFSASSISYLKTAFLFSLFMVSLEDDLVLFPRFSLMDDIEDKGSTPERVQNMHNYIIKQLESIEQDYQIIFTTSVLSDNLNNSDYCVGPEYSFDLKTLNLS